jgi:hypothetical protein
MQMKIVELKLGTAKNIGNENTVPLQNFSMHLALKVSPDLVFAKKKKKLQIW